jgi:hypothetical protein
VVCDIATRRTVVSIADSMLICILAIGLFPILRTGPLPRIASRHALRVVGKRNASSARRTVALALEPDSPARWGIFTGVTFNLA